MSRELGVEMSPVTSGPLVNESLETNVEGVFACGNVLHVHDLVDFVSQEAQAAGKHAAQYVLQGKKQGGRDIPIVATEGARYTVPKTINLQRMEEKQVIRFRVGDVYKNRNIAVYFDDERVIYRKRPVLAPGEMEQIELKKEQLESYPDLKQITVKIED